MRFLSSIILIFLSSMAFGNSAFDRGVKAYEAKKFDDAVLIFDSIYSETPHDASVCFNLAKSYESKGNLGKAMLFFERCLVLSPYDNEAREFAEKISIETVNLPRVKNSSPVEKALLSFSPNFWAILAIVFAILIGLFIFLITRGKNPQKKRLYFGLSILCAFFLVGAIFAANSTKNHFQNETIGYITLPKTPTYTENGMMTSETIPQATRIEISKKLKNNFFKVHTQTGKTVVLKGVDFEIL